MKDRNIFRTGTARHNTEDDVLDELDFGPVAASFQEISEYTENQLAFSLIPGIDTTSSRVSEFGANQVKPEEIYPGTEDSVAEYLDRFPSSGS